MLLLLLLLLLLCFVAVGVVAVVVDVVVAIFVIVVAASVDYCCCLDMETDRDCFNFSVPESPEPFPTAPEAYDEVEVHTPLLPPGDMASIQPVTPSDVPDMAHLGTEIDHAIDSMIPKT